MSRWWLNAFAGWSPKHKNGGPRTVWLRLHFCFVMRCSLRSVLALFKCTHTRIDPKHLGNATRQTILALQLLYAFWPACSLISTSCSIPPSASTPSPPPLFCWSHRRSPPLPSACDFSRNLRRNLLENPLRLGEQQGRLERHVASVGGNRPFGRWTGSSMPREFGFWRLVSWLF